MASKDNVLRVSIDRQDGACREVIKYNSIAKDFNEYITPPGKFVYNAPVPPYTDGRNKLYAARTTVL